MKSFREIAVGVAKAMVNKSIMCGVLAALVLSLSSPTCWAQLAKYSPSSATASFDNGKAASTTAANVTVTDFVRGPGLGTSGTPAGNSYGGSGADQTTLANAIANGDYFTMTIKANTGFTISLTDIPTWFTRKSGSGTMSAYVQYSLNGGTYTDIGSVSITSTSSGGSSTALTFSTAVQTALANLPSTTTVTLRFVIVSSTSANVYLFTGSTTANTDRLIINGTVAAAATTYTVTYNGNGNTGGTAPSDSSSPYSSGSSVTVLGAGTLAKTGYTFAGWNTAANGTGTSYAAGATFSIAANTTLYAQWTINTYTLTYTAGPNGSISGTSPQTVNYNTSGSAVTAVPNTGYHFVNWSDSSTANPRTDSSVIANISVTANFAINTYTVTYNANGGTGSQPDPNSPYNYNSTVTVPGAGGIARTGYTFTGWNTAADGSGTGYAPGATFAISANTTLYAQWTINSYTLTYDGNGNDGGSAPSPVTQNFNTTTTVSGPGTLTKSGSSFAGWNTVAAGGGTGYVAGNSFTFTGNTTLFAQWSSTPTITLSGTLAAVNTTYGAASASPTSFAISGVNLTGDLTVTPPSGFEVSLSSGSGYTTSLTIPASGTLASTTVYVRLAATTAASGSPYSGNITVSGGSATSQTIATASSTVAQAPLTITGLTGVNKVYDRTTNATATGVAAYSGLVNDESFSVTGTPVFGFTNYTIGTSKTILVSGYTAPTANYSLTQPTLTANITPLPLTVSGAGVTNKVYDGTTAATITNATLIGVISPDVVTITSAVSNGYFASPNAGSGIAVTATLALTGANATNYSLTQPTGLAGEIFKANQSIVFAALADKYISDPPFTLSATASSGLGTFSYSSDNPSVATISGNTVTITGAGTATITASQAGDGNYNASSTNRTLTVTVPPTPLIAGWDFQTTSSGGTASAAAPNSPTIYVANVGAGTIYLNGSFGSSTWITATSGNELNAFAGTAVNATSGSGLSTTTTSPACLALVGGTSQSANGKRIVFKFSMANRVGLIVSYATQTSGTTGFTTQLWEYSTDGINWITAESIGSIPTSFGTKTLATINGLNGVSTAYLRLTVSGATGSTGNNRLDNIQLRATDMPVISGVTASQSITYGTASVTLSGTVSTAGLLYPANGETVNVTINGSTQPATISGSLGGFSVNFPTATIPPSPSAYTITYAYAGNSYLPAAANNTSTALTVTGIKVPNLTYTNTSGVVRIITLTELQAAGLASSQSSPAYSITNLSATTSGGFVTTNSSGTLMKYTNSPSFAAPSDSFTYTITDGAVSGTGTVSITFTNVAGPLISSGGTDGFGHPVLTFQGLPGYGYHIQRASTLSPPDWVNQDPAITVPLNGNGSVTWTNDQNDPVPSPAYYRLSYP